ncbi:ac111-like protein [Clanis bilineata nucleopolyhedrovirus]|uniref:Ac111-like protein n=1 Tax=Clanis bilineata nucleopolyhedrovirus TaxID=1307957 RepID=Q0N442_9ABAC|nr:ac111-like protein [Clanis bilineata nucleopolyhedrovirus]ABF47401.1 ac111-like protein [Clanis bilineata nucleopolyhedrovirus]
MENTYAVHEFYNNKRKVLNSTTLHDGNILPSTYEQVLFIRKLMCKESLQYQGKQDKQFKTKGHNKEN